MYKVLLIDDEADVTTFFTGVFTNMPNVKFFSAMRARQGIELAKQERPKVIMVDLRMPDISGEDVLKELVPALPESKFIVMTGWDDDKAKERIMQEFKVEHYYAKPINLEEVVSKVTNLLMVKGS